MAHNEAVRIWDPRWLTVWLCAFGIPDGSRCGCAHLGSHMAHNEAVRIWDPRWLTVCAVRIWDPRWLTVCLCAFGIPDGSQFVL